MSDSETSPLFKESEGEISETKYDTRKILLGIERHLGIIALSILLWAVLGALATWYFTHHYTAEAVVIYQEDLPKTLPGGITLNNLSLATSLDLIQLPTNFQAVKAILGLSLPPKKIESMVSVPFPRANSHLIRIITKADNPNLALDISNTLAKISVKNSQDFLQKQLQSEFENFRGQLDQANLRQATEQNEIEEFKKTHKYFEMTADYATLLSHLVELRGELQKATLQYNSLSVEYENLKNEEKNLGIGESRDRYYDPLQTRIHTLESTLAEAKSKYAPENPKIKRIEDELNTLTEKAKIAAVTEERASPELIRLQGKVRSAQKTKQDLTAAVEKLEKQMETLPSEQLEFSKLLQNSKMTQTEIQFLTTSLETIQLMINVPKGSLELYQLADRAKPLRDNWWVNLLPLLGLLLGLGFGLGWAAFIEMKDKKIWTPKQVELSYTIPPLVQIPDLGRLTKENCSQKLLFFSRTLAERIERYAASLPKKNGGLIIALVSSKQGEGKSLLSTQLALYYQRLAKKTLLIEMDSKPNPFSDDALPTSLNTYFEKGEKWQEALVKGNIDRIKAWGDDPYMKEVIKSQSMPQFIEKLRKTYDMILIDAPGIIEEHYAVNLATLSDFCIFIIGSKDTDKAIIDESLRELNHAGIKPMGIVLNQVNPVYIEDEKIKQEMGRIKSPFWERLFTWR